MSWCTVGVINISTVIMNLRDANLTVIIGVIMIIQVLLEAVDQILHLVHHLKAVFLLVK